MSETAQASDSEIDDPNKITDAASCLDYLKRREVFLYKMINDPSHKAMLYFLEVLMNAETAITIDQLASRFNHKSFSQEMRDACGGGSVDGLNEFLQRYPSLFSVRPNGQVTSVAIELPGLDMQLENFSDHDSYSGLNSIKENDRKLMHSVDENASTNLTNHTRTISKESFHSKLKTRRKQLNIDYKGGSVSSLSMMSANSLNGSFSSITSSNAVVNSFDKAEQKSVPNNLSNQKSSSNPSTCSKATNIYQPPHLRDPTRTAQTIINSSCEMCPTGFHTNQVVTNGLNNTSCIHCPLLEFTCHHGHHFAAAHHHHQYANPHCPCVPNVIGGGQTFHHCHPIHATSPVNSVKQTNYCTLPPMEKLMLETEAVRFFQQRLIKREERWVLIKSLAGHLSQASAEIRAVVGPQLEFRRFLLKHPHVFEVQGDLVSVKDPFSGMLSNKKSRDRVSFTNFSQSSTNLTRTEVHTTPYMSRNLAHLRNTRPKSLILADTQLNPTEMGYVTRRPTFNRRSTHFADSPVAVHNSRPTTASINNNNNNNNILSNNNSFVPTEPKLFNKFDQLEKLNSTAMNSSFELDSSMNTISRTDLTSNSNSLSITMSANEYRAIMFLRKLLGRNNAVEGKVGLRICDLIQYLTNKAPESVQTTIGWTRIELLEFINHHDLFFELCSRNKNTNATTTTTNNNDNSNNSTGTLSVFSSSLTPPTSSVVTDDIDGEANNNLDDKPNQTCNSNDVLNKEAQTEVETRGEGEEDGGGDDDDDEQISVRNKRLNRMINIIITGNKSPDLGVRTLTNRCGRIFHVAKLWGIIDLGKHEHVFFDKSIFRHVDDLQKHFKVDENLYFNAILAPKESRAKWRATQVWKECDRENVEKFGAMSQLNGPSNKRNTINSSTNYDNPNIKLTGNRSEQGSLNQNIIGNRHSRDVCTNPQRLTITQQIKDDNDDDTELDEEIDGMEFENKQNRHVIKHADILDYELALISDEELDEDEPLISALAREEGLLLANDIKFLADEVDEEMERVLNDKTRIKRSSQFVEDLDNQVHSTDCGPSIIDDKYQQQQKCERRNSLVTSSTGPMQNSFTSQKLDSDASSSVSDTNAVTIAVQTLSTGDIMATQLYHDYES